MCFGDGEYHLCPCHQNGPIPVFNEDHSVVVTTGQDAEDIYQGSDRLVRDCLRLVLIDMASLNGRNDPGWSLRKLGWFDIE